MGAVGTAGGGCRLVPAESLRDQGYEVAHLRSDIAAGKCAHRSVLSGWTLVPAAFSPRVRGDGDANVRTC